MKDSLNYIDDYFNGNLSREEKKAFESRCIADPAFAKEVAFVISVRDGLKQELYTQKKKQFDDLYRELAGKEPKAIKISRKFAPYLAAASLVIVVALVFLLKAPSSENLANNYIVKNLNTLSVTMGDADSLQLGIAAYNNKDYKQAETVFKRLVTKPDVSDKAIENLGIVYLITEKYEDALMQFEKLSQRDLYANPGPFYKALVLIKRSHGEDKANAKKILQEVIAKDLPGRREAEVWIKNL